MMTKHFLAVFSKSGHIVACSFKKYSLSCLVCGRILNVFCNFASQFAFVDFSKGQRCELTIRESYV